MKHSDRPVTRPSDDLLGRSRFSLALARSIDTLLLAKDGFVIAVIGDWGAGKSSVIEMTLRHLTHIEMERVAALASEEPQTLDALEKLADVYDIIRDRVDVYDVSGFNFSNTRFDYRVDQFKKWLESEEEAKKADTYWKLLQTTEGQRRTIQVRFSPWLIAGRSELATALLSELARALGEKLGPGIQKAFASLLGRLGELAPIQRISSA
ncbi:P-loop NTPase fold protein [Tardiphaga sp. 841_E9_N1_2]|uniref:P-loop NTPase fold protein n=1 Tax=Tardiphaga sp. 841_E9_N1_2 TaxID=3240762 RepID=UPI003F21BD90